MRTTAATMMSFSVTPSPENAVRSRRLYSFRSRQLRLLDVDYVLDHRTANFRLGARRGHPATVRKLRFSSGARNKVAFPCGSRRRRCSQDLLRLERRYQHVETTTDSAPPARATRRQDERTQRGSAERGSLSPWP